jgi:Flp pilus assembly protein CpaB
MARNISTGTMGVAVLAIFAGLIGAYAVRAALRTPTPPAPQPAATLPLAAVDLPAGRIVALGDIRLVPMTGERIDELTQRNIPVQSVIPAPQFIVGRRLKGPLSQNDPFQVTNVYLDGTGPDLTERIKPGFRAFKLSISNLRGGWVTSGKRVDVLLRSEPQRSQGGTQSIPETTVTLLEDVEVLEVERDEVRRLAVTSPADAARTGNSNNQASNFEQPTVVARSNEATVTLAVTPEQSVILQTVEGRGEISLVARPEAESFGGATGRREAMTLEDILGITPPTPPTPPEPPFETEIYRRTARQVNSFEEDRLSGQAGDPGPLQPVMPRVESSVTPDRANRATDNNVSTT